MVQSIFLEPEEYDLLHADVVDDIPFYLKLVREYGGPILELGCGTGRISIPIAMEGFRVVGVDVSFPMVRRAFLRGMDAGLNLKCVVGDMRSIPVSGRYPLIIVPYNAFSHLYTFDDVVAFFREVRALMDSNGKLVIDVFNPDADILRGSMVRKLVGSYERNGRRVMVYGTGWYDFATQINHIKWYFSDGEREWSREFTMRVFFPQEIMNYARFMGFRVDAMYGDYSGGRITASSPRILLILSVDG